MSIQVYQLLTLSVYGLLAIFIYKSKSNRIRFVLAIVAFVVFALNPIRHHQEGVAKMEIGVSRFGDIPEAVKTNEETFQQKQERQMKQLKTDTGNLKNEIHN